MAQLRRRSRQLPCARHKRRSGAYASAAILTVSQQPTAPDASKALPPAAQTIALTLRSHAALALPLAAQQIGQQLMAAVDVAMLGHYAPAALSGSGVGNGLLFTITCIGVGVMMGLDSIAPAALGEGNPGRAHRGFVAAVRAAILVGIVSSVIVALAPLVLRVGSVPADVQAHASSYVYVRAIGVVPYLLSVALRSYLSAFGVTRPLLYAVVVGNLVNLGADAALIFGVPALGVPALGTVGAALATTTVNLLTLLYFAHIARGIWRESQLPFASATASDEDRRALWRLGTPIGLHMLAEIGIFALAGLLAANWSAHESAAHNVALMLASFAFSIALGIGAATANRVGYAHGAGDHAGVRRAGVHGLILGAGVMSATAALFLFAPAPLARLFAADPLVVALAVPLLQVAAFFQLADGAQAILAGALRGIGDNRATFVANVLGHYAIGLAISLATGYGLGYRTVGIWWGLSGGLVATAIMLAWRFFGRVRQP